MQHLQCAAIGLDPRTNLGTFAKRMVTKKSSRLSVFPNETPFPQTPFPCNFLFEISFYNKERR
jgi:hypothetical protein